MTSESVDVGDSREIATSTHRRFGAVVLLGICVLVATAALAGVGTAAGPEGGTLPQVEPTANLSVSPDPVRVGGTVTLDARGSTGGNAAVETCEFDVDGDGQPEVQNGTCLAEWQYGTVGQYEVTVVVRTADGDSSTATADLTVVENRAPTPVLSVEPAEPHPGESVTLSAARSQDPDGRVVRTVWALPERTFEGETVNVTFPEPGEYPITLRVVDAEGRENETSRLLRVVANEPPAATLGLATDQPRVGEPVELDATETLDADGRVAEFQWDLDGDGSVNNTTATGRTSVVFDEPGTRTVTVVAVDDDGASASDSISFEVGPAVTADETDATSDPSTASQPTSASGDGLLWSLDVGLVPAVPDWALLLIVAVLAVGAGGAWRRREVLRSRIDGLRDRVTRGDFRRRVARTATGTVTKTAAKRLLRTAADAIDASGRGVGGGLERLGRAIRRWSSRIASALRRLAS